MILKGVLKDFFYVPLAEGIRGAVFGTRGKTYLLAEKTEEPFFFARAAGFFGNEYLKRIRETPGAAVEQFVVESAEAEPIRLFGRASGLVPFDVSCFYAYRGKSEVEAHVTNAAAIIVCPKDSMAKFGISR